MQQHEAECSGRNNFDKNEIKRQTWKDKLSGNYLLPEETDESSGRRKEDEGPSNDGG